MSPRLSTLRFVAGSVAYLLAVLPAVAQNSAGSLEESLLIADAQEDQDQIPWTELFE